MYRERRTHLALVVRRQPFVRFPFVVEHPGEAAVRSVAPYGSTRGPVAAGDVADGVLTAVRTPDYMGLVRARHAAVISRAFDTSVTRLLRCHALSRAVPHVSRRESPPRAWPLNQHSPDAKPSHTGHGP